MRPALLSVLGLLLYLSQACRTTPLPGGCVGTESGGGTPPPNLTYQSAGPSSKPCGKEKVTSSPQEQIEGQRHQLTPAEENMPEFARESGEGKLPDVEVEDGDYSYLYQHDDVQEEQQPMKDKNGWKKEKMTEGESSQSGAAQRKQLPGHLADLPWHMRSTIFHRDILVPSVRHVQPEDIVAHWAKYFSPRPIERSQSWIGHQTDSSDDENEEEGKPKKDDIWKNAGEDRNYKYSL